MIYFDEIWIKYIYPDIKCHPLASIIEEEQRKLNSLVSSAIEECVVDGKFDHRRLNHKMKEIAHERRYKED